MKLNADILFDYIVQVFPAEMTGYRTSELTLGRPEFYLDEKEPFRTGHLYLVSGDRISRRAVVEKGSVIICIGEIPQTSYFHSNCCFIQISGTADLLQLFNLLQNIYNRYDSWSEQLSSILETTASVEDMTEISFPIFGNPLLVLDSSFRLIAHAGFHSLDFIPEDLDFLDTSELSLTSLDKYLKHRELKLHVREPLLLETAGVTTLSMNLFDGAEYAGSITVEYLKTQHKPGDEALIVYFARYAALAIKRNSSVISSERSILRRVFQNMINGLPIDTVHRKYLDSRKNRRKFVCALLQLNNRYAQIPSEYVCSKIESVFPQSITFENRSHIIAFIETGPLEETDGSLTELKRRLDLLVGTMDLKIGISDPFTDPYQARMYHSQARAALENGILSQPDRSCFFFDDFALMELIINAQSDLPLELYFSDGLRRLLAHDAESSTSYVQTLRTYLNYNMNVTRTASALYIHRSTLLERLSRIQRELDEDLENPDVRLRLQILLKALELQETVRRLRT